MVQSTAATVDAWFEEVEPARRPYFASVRELACKHLGAANEQMRYGVPVYARPGDEAPCFAFASQKGYISLYVNPQAQSVYEAELAGANKGKSCIRFRRGELIDMDLVDRLLAETAKLGPVEYRRGS